MQPPNRFTAIHVEEDYDQLDDTDDLSALRRVRTEYFADDSQSIVSQNDSPDIPFRYSVNPYRGCAHGCSYCYARPTHEYLGLNAGLDFESKVFVKLKAASLFRDWLCRADYEPEMVMFSGVTDCYQPAERQFKLTRACLEVAREARQPIAVITKNTLVTRDLDILTEMAASRLVGVALSLTTLDARLARTMEPRTSSPEARLRAIRELSAAGVSTRVMVAPVIPGLNDHEIPGILAAAAEAGAQTAGYVLLRLPLTVAPVFVEWLERTQALSQSRIESLIRNTRDGRMSSSEFGNRMRGTGQIADQIRQTFRVFAKKHGLDQPPMPLNVTQFVPPVASSGQLRLF